MKFYYNIFFSNFIFVHFLSPNFLNTLSPLIFLIKSFIREIQDGNQILKLIVLIFFFFKMANEKDHCTLKIYIYNGITTCPINIQN